MSAFAADAPGWDGRSSGTGGAPAEGRPKIIVSDQLYWEQDFFDEFVPLVKDAVDVISWHDYPLGPGYNNPSLEAVGSCSLVTWG